MSDVQKSQPDAASERAQTSPAHFILVRIPHVISGALLLVAIAINIANVIGRYVFSRPVDWAEEALIYIIVWAVFISLGSITYQGLHLRMDLLVMHAKGWLRMLLGGLTAVLMVACAVFMLFQTVPILRFYLGTGETSMGAKIPLVYPHAALLVGFAGLAVAAIVRFRCYLTGKFD
jgi:TRAP-type transport system small permease protein